jgi:hypothetical protein
VPGRAMGRCAIAPRSKDIILSSILQNPQIKGFSNLEVRENIVPRRPRPVLR